MRKFYKLMLFAFIITIAETVLAIGNEPSRELEEFFDLEVSKTGISSLPPATFSLNELSSFIPQIPKVNVVTGEYCEEECDLVVAGIEPLSYRRFYEHKGFKDKAYGHWRINPEALFLFNFDLTKRTGQKFNTLVGTGEDNGFFLLYEKKENNRFIFDAKKNCSFTHSGISGQTHPLNSQVSYCKRDGKEDYCFYEGTFKTGDGDARSFKTMWNVWPENKNIISSGWTAPPYQAMITERRKPNGNIIKYSYINCNEGISCQPYYLLKSIIAYNSSRTKILSSLDIHYIRGSKKYGSLIEKITVKGSDGRSADLFHNRREVQARNKRKGRSGIYDIVLDHVKAPSKPIQIYNYSWDKAKYYFDHPYMWHSGQPEGRVLKTIYEGNTKKVKEQKMPIGPNDEMLPIARYEYKKDHTIVYDGENQKTIYRYHTDKRITAVEKYDGDQLVHVERSEWNPLNGNLVRKKIEDGCGKILQLREYEYDHNHNVVEERIRDEKSGDKIRRTFSDDSFNLMLTESDRPGKLIRYNYIPKTNLISSEITYEHDRIVKRIFHFYDNEISSVRVKTIIDDGHSSKPYDLANIGYRKILEIEPKRTFPCVGLPEEVQEKSIDSYGNEILLKKVRYTYHPSGKVEREDHYDANNIYRYCIINEYDEKERLIATIDALGLRTTFSYDANFNLISQDGPRADIHKEWSYDKVNRPIQEREWQTDGTILVTEKKYDKCSRLISQVDTCGFETICKYNAPGQLTAIIHPDGSIERKEYDALGNVIKEIDANGHITRKEYNFRSQPTAIYHADDREEHFTYNIDGGTLASHIDPSGTKTIYFYDCFDNPIKTEVYSPKGDILAITSATFSSFYKLSETDAEGITTHYTYDLAGRLITKKIGDQTVSYTYNELGHLAHTQEGNIITTNVFDMKGQLFEKRIVGLDHQDYFQETYAYDEAGNRISVKTCVGISQTEHNSRGDPIQKIDPLGNTTDITYSYRDCFIKTTRNSKGVQILEIHDARGRLIDLQIKNTSDQVIQRREKRYDPAGNQTHLIEYVFEGPTLRETITHEWIYGPNGRIEKVIEAGEKITQYLYDHAGKLKTIIKPDGAEIHHKYDPRGRLSRYYGTGIDYAYTYDHKNRLLEVEDKIFKTTTNRVYDIYDNVVEERLASGLTICSHYDPYGRRTALYLPDGSEVIFTYQGPYLYSVSRNGYTHTYSERNLAGKPTLISLPNNSGTISITCDPLLRWDKVHSPYYQANCSYDSVGNLIEYSYTDPLGSENQFYQYDDLNQLISENEHDYQYDSLFNRTGKDDNSYSLNPLCQITHDGQKEYVYDKNGNLISDGESTYEYDLLDRLIAVTKGGMHTTYTYDAFNRRIAKNDKLYIWDDKNEIGMSRGGKVRELRILGEGLGAEIGSSVIFEIGGYTYFPIHNIQGSLAIMLNTSGQPKSTCRYTAFGEQLIEDSESPWRFASKRYDKETDFIYFGRRYYSPALGRWITPDPKGFEDGPNLYAYVQNSPLTAWDLYGLSTISYTDNFKAFWHRLKGANCAFRDMAFDFASRMGGMTFSNTASVFDQKGAMLGNWEDLSFGKLNDYPNFALRTALPYTYDLHHLPKDISQEQRWFAEGRAGFEQGMFLFAGAKGLQSMRGFEFASHKAVNASIVDLTSSEYCFSGKVRIAEKKNTGRSRLQPDTQAEGLHSVFRRDSSTGKVTHYETFSPQTNHYDPKPWESVLRYDAIGKSHFNKLSDSWISTPHIHDPFYRGGIRKPYIFEIPK